MVDVQVSHTKRAANYDGRAVLDIEPTLSQEWSEDKVRGPQCAFEMSMFMCPAVRMMTRN